MPMPDHRGHERTPPGRCDRPRRTDVGRYADGGQRGTDPRSAHAAVTEHPRRRSSSRRIVDEAKRVLAEVGMEIRGPEMRRRLLEHGLPLDHGRRPGPLPARRRRAGDRRRAPRRSCSTTATGDPHADLGGDRVHFVPGSSGLKVLDHRTGETRLANSTDFVEYVRLADGLANIPYLATAFSTNDDIEAQVSDAWRLYMTLTNSNKPVVSGAFTEHGVPRMVEMMQLFRRDRADLIARPMSIFTITATGNFRYSEDSCQNLIDCVEAGIAVEIVPVTLMGLIAPVTHRRRDGLPHRRRAGRDHHGPDRPARRARAVRRRAGDVPHEDRAARRCRRSRRSSSTPRTSRSPSRWACRPSRTWRCRTGRSSTRRPAPRRSGAR